MVTLTTNALTTSAVLLVPINLWNETILESVIYPYNFVGTSDLKLCVWIRDDNRRFQHFSLLLFLLQLFSRAVALRTSFSLVEYTYIFSLLLLALAHR